MSFQDLADAVHIRKASVHHHFPTKSDLLAALVRGYGGATSSEIRDIASLTCSGDNKLRLFISQLAHPVGPCEELFIEMRRALERQLVVPYSERPPTSNRPVAAGNTVENAGTVVLRNAGEANSQNPQ